MANATPWYRNAIVYGIDVKTFHDGNGDGIGDFQGLTEKLNYFVDLGVTTLWLLPFFPSPNRDNGYDISNYYGVDERLGTLDDFVSFARRAKERGLRVMVDVVVNHTSVEHPWFKAARLDRESRFRNYYIWTQDPPPTPADGGNIFEGQEPTVWTHDEVAGAYYYHRFYHHQPSLNAKEPRVLEEVRAIADFWLSVGADALRMDAVSHMVQGPDLEEARPQSPQSILRELRSFLDRRAPDAAVMGEADEPVAELDRYFGEGDQLHMLLNFYLNNHVFLSLARNSAAPILRAIDLLPSVPPTCQWANFLRNFDEVDLERLSADDREEVFAAFAPDPDMRIFDRGIRRRLAPMLDGDDARMLMAFALLLSMRGAPVLMYGDEIGMGERLDLPGRDAVRTPMQWSDEPNGGFSTADPERLIRPLVDAGPFSYDRVNVQSQREDPASFLSRVQALIHARRSAPEIGDGDLEILRTEEDAVLVHTLKRHNRRFVGIHNLSPEPQEVSFVVPSQAAFGFEQIASSDATPQPLDMPFRVEGYGFRWYQADPRGKA